MSVADFLNRDVVITRGVGVQPDGQGGFSSTVAGAVMGTARGMLNPASASDVTIAARRSVVATHVLYTGAAEDIQVNDILLIDSEGYGVVALQRASDPNHYLKVLLRSTTPDGFRE